MNTITDVVNRTRIQLSKIEKEIEECNIPELTKRLNNVNQKIDELTSITGELDMMKDRVDCIMPEHDGDNNV